MYTDKQIRQIANNLPEYGYEVVGLRVQESDYGVSIGDVVTHVSSVWDDGEETEDQLDGICAVSVELAQRYMLSFGAYDGNVILVLGSNTKQYGEDDGEIILRNPVVLDIIH